MIRNIYLYGLIAEEFGDKWTLDVESVAEGAHAINVNTGGKFFDVVKDMELRVIRGHDLESGEVLDKSMLPINSKNGDYHICPVAKGASGEIIFGAILIASLIIGAVVAYTMIPTIRAEDAMESDVKGYSFGGPTNSSNQGIPVPLIYGEVYSGSVVISQGIRSEELT